jgi:beta-barrel assembly-enhancing protease
MRQMWAALVATGLVGCEGGINIFTIQDDIDLGAELAVEIEANPDVYGPILDRAAYPDAYARLDTMRDDLLATGQVEHAEDFEWPTHIIEDDAVLNAFAAPGGYIYVYTGLIKYLEVEDHFVGVLGHELAHAARRHSTDQLTKAYGLSTLISIVLGDGTAGDIAQIAGGLLTLEFSREDESEADDFSVIYLCETEYAADGTAGFFEKIIEDSEGGGYSVPEFLSTHPSSDTRVGDIRAKALELGCSTEENPNADWAGFLATLP